MYQRDAVVLPAGKLIEKAGCAHAYQIRCLILFSFQWLIAAIIFAGYKFLFLVPKLICFNTSTPPFTCTEAEACSGDYTYDYDSDSMGSLISDFDLLCDKEHYIDLSQTASYVGAFLGSYYYTEIQQRKGRLFTLHQTTSLIGMVSMGAIISFNIYLNLIAVFLAHFALFALMNSTIIYFSEISSDNLRAAGPNVFLIGWALGSVVLSISMKFLDGWKSLTFFAMGVPMFVTALYYRFIKDSPRFLVGLEKFEEARASILNIAKINNRPIPNFVFESEVKNTFFGDTYGAIFKRDAQDELLPKNKVKTILTLFQYKSLKHISLQLLSLRIFLTIANHGSVLAFNTFHKEPSQSLLTDGVVEMFGYIFACYCALRLKRKTIFKATFTVIGFIYLAFFLVGIRPSDIDIEHARGLVILFLVFGRWAICIAEGMLFVYQVETIPTSVRHFSFGLNTGVAYFALFIINYLDVIFREPHLIFLFIIGIAFIAHAQFTEELPETYGKSTYDTIREEDDLLINIEMY